MISGLLAVAAALAITTIPGGASDVARAATARHIVVLTGSNINQVTSNQPLLRPFFDHRRVLSLGNPAADQVQAVGVPRSTPTLIYRSYATFAAGVAAGRIDSRIRAVAYDPEYWADTPPVEQADPVSFMQRFAALARQHGYEVIMTPGRDLMLDTTAACHKQTGETLDHAYLRCGIPGAAARVADIVEVQSQVDEFSATRFGWLLRSAAGQARAANPTVKVLAGVSTQPPTGKATFASTVQDARIAAATTDGMWVNVFAGRPGQRRVGEELFRWMQRHNY
jgi:hypothetical protein